MAPATPTITPAPSLATDLLVDRSFTIPSVISLPFSLGSVVFPSSIVVDISTVLTFPTVIGGVTIPAGSTIVIGGSATSAPASATPTSSGIVTGSSSIPSTTPPPSSSPAIVSPTSVIQPATSHPSRSGAASSTTKILAGVFSTFALLLLICLCAGIWLLARRRRRRRLAQDEDAAAKVPSHRHSWHLVGGEDEKMGGDSTDDVAMAGAGQRDRSSRTEKGRRASAASAAYDPTPAFLPLMHPQGTYIPSDPRYVPQPPSPMEVYYATPVKTTFDSAAADTVRGTRRDPFGDDVDIMEVRRGEEDAPALGAGFAGGVGSATSSSSDTLSSASEYRHRPGYGPDHDPEYAFAGTPPSPPSEEARTSAGSHSQSRTGSLVHLRGGAAPSSSTPGYYHYAPFRMGPASSSSSGAGAGAGARAGRPRRLPDPPAGAMVYPYPPGRGMHSPLSLGGESSPPVTPSSGSFSTSYGQHHPASSYRQHPRFPSSSQGHDLLETPSPVAEEPGGERSPRRARSNSGYASWFNRRRASGAEQLLPPPAVLPEWFGPGTDASVPVRDASDYFSARELRVANRSDEER
ncbi:hypothetical protein PUNSTDRAFT_143775 [Punctularia strigosozonata HHB-11173 SS5]|uniref:uncharacterized protein n=1 Tax=Punctularia strigosozonata (strain HHB-11173) TaxID=741275 RepID=UPI000441814D|nr:uncharacterized protein PUNSTDRAFT_143775 [Punctularia strigosozonata HHB-11173 SS5]EIN09273.1 hypothetical protein PUNSTDRAFT_143775 [Punctularia strigosozonata HHB-11173 SS5]